MRVQVLIRCSQGQHWVAVCLVLFIFIPTPVSIKIYLVLIGGSNSLYFDQRMVSVRSNTIYYILQPILIK